MQETLVKCGFLARMTHARRNHRDESEAARERSGRARSRVGIDAKSMQKIFLDFVAESRRGRPASEQNRANHPTTDSRSHRLGATTTTLDARENASRACSRRPRADDLGG
jgi:hypothetical protein